MALHYNTSYYSTFYKVLIFKSANYFCRNYKSVDTGQKERMCPGEGYGLYNIKTFFVYSQYEK